MEVVIKCRRFGKEWLLKNIKECSLFMFTAPLHGKLLSGQSYEIMSRLSDRYLEAKEMKTLKIKQTRYDISSSYAQ